MTCMYTGLSFAFSDKSGSLDYIYLLPHDLLCIPLWQTVMNVRIVSAHSAFWDCSVRPSNAYLCFGIWLKNLHVLTLSVFFTSLSQQRRLAQALVAFQKLALACEHAPPPRQFNSTCILRHVCLKKFNFCGSAVSHAPKDDIHQRLLCDIYYIYNIIKRASDRGPRWRRLYNRSYILLYSDGSRIIAPAKNCCGLILPDPNSNERQAVAQEKRWENYQVE